MFKATATTQDAENLPLPEQKAALPAEDPGTTHAFSKKYKIQEPINIQGNQQQTSGF